MSSNNSNKYYVTTCHVHERARWEKTTKHIMNEYKNNYMMMWDGKCKVSSVMLYIINLENTKSNVIQW